MLTVLCSVTHLFTAIPCGRKERAPASARSVPAKDVERAASGDEKASAPSDSGAPQPEGLRARIQGLVQSLRAATEVSALGVISHLSLLVSRTLYSI